MGGLETPQIDTSGLNLKLHSDQFSITMSLGLEELCNIFNNVQWY